MTPTIHTTGKLLTIIIFIASHIDTTTQHSLIVAVVMIRYYVCMLLSLSLVLIVGVKVPGVTS
jgi:hypothetical protein